MFEEAQEFLVAMARLALRNNPVLQHIERREQGGGPVAIIVVGYSFHITQPDRQHRLGALQSLHLALLVDTQNQRIVGWIKIQPNDIAHLLDGRMGRSRV